MSKKLFIIIISITLAVFLVGLVSYYFLLKDNGGDSTNTNSVFSNLFPFGDNTETSTTTDTTIETEPQQSNYEKKLRKITSEPVAGVGVLDYKAGTVLRYIEKATGHIYEVELFSPKQGRISNTTMPMVYDALWNSQNSSLVARFLEDDNQTINTYSLSIKDVASSTEAGVSAVKFPDDLDGLSVYGNSVFFLEKTDNSSVGYISNFDGNKKVQVWNSPIKELLSQYVNSKTVALTTKPHEDVNGFLFFVNTGTGQSRQILGNILGLSVLVDNTATQVLFLNQKDSSFQMSVFNISSGSYTEITPTTFPEKCVWSKKDKNVFYCAVPGEFVGRTSLTSWYKGFTSFTDSIWKYDIKDNTSSMIEDMVSESGEQIDVTKPVLSEGEQYLVFINKIDNALWSFDLTK